MMIPLFWRLWNVCWISRESGFCCNDLILLILQSSVFWLSSQIWFWKSLSFTFPEKRFQTWPVSVTFKVHLVWGNMAHITQPCWKSHDALHKKREWETCAEPDPAIPNATLGVPVKKGVLSEVLPSPQSFSLSVHRLLTRMWNRRYNLHS